MNLQRLGFYPAGAYVIYAVLLVTICPGGLLLAGEPDRDRLNDSPRHQEWVSLDAGDRSLQAFLVYPEVKEKATAVIVIHENRGLTDWVCSVADQLAEAGYIAIAPDLLSGMAPGGGRTSDFPNSGAAREALYQLPEEQIKADMNKVFNFVAALPGANGKVAVAGFCWGGEQSFLFATRRPELSASFVFYGSPPESQEAVAHINCPVYGFYGGNDARVNASIPSIKGMMKSAGKVYDQVIYEGAGHGFMRAGEAPDASEANQKARKSGWSRWLELLQGI